MIIVLVLACVLLVTSVAANVFLLKKLFYYQDLFDKLHDFILMIVEFTSKFEGKRLLSDSPEAIHLHRLMMSVREFFRPFEATEADTDG